MYAHGMFIFLTFLFFLVFVFLYLLSDVDHEVDVGLHGWVSTPGTTLATP